MKKLFLFAAMMACLHAVAQTPTAMTDHALHKGYDISKDQENDGLVFNGQIGFADLEHEASFDWFKTGVKEYKPSAQAVDYLKQRLPGYHLVIFMGTWCDDSHNLIPKLYKTLLDTKYNNTYIMYGTDRAKTTKDGAQKPFNITLVPTIILLDEKNNEAGRITETVKNSIEQDLADIIKADMAQKKVH